MRRLIASSLRSVAAAGVLLGGSNWLVAQEMRPSVHHEGGADNAIAVEARADFTRPTNQSLMDTRTPEDSDYQPPVPSQKPLLAASPATHRPAIKRPMKAHLRQIVISIPDRRLALLQDGELVRVYKVAVGSKDTPSPAGEFIILNHAVDPTYWHEGKGIGPGNGNPLGNRWIGLSRKGYGIHGTNVQSSVGRAASHGCFRMKKRDVEDLYSRVQVGDQVSVRSDRDELTTRLFAEDTSATVTANNQQDAGGTEE